MLTFVIGMRHACITYVLKFGPNRYFDLEPV